MCSVYREELPEEVTSGEKEVTGQMKDKDAVDRIQFGLWMQGNL